jgi:gliding motility-associated-like protein
MKRNFTPYNNILALAFLLCCLSTITAQTYNDGAMNIQMTVGYSWVESVDDPVLGELNDNEFRWKWWGDVNGLSIGWQGGTTIGVNTSNYGWVNPQDVNLFNQTFGTIGSTPSLVPQFLQLRGEGWEDDCFDCYRSTGTFTWACDQCSSYVYDGSCGCSTNILCGCSAEDQHCGPYVISSNINYRVIAPCLNLVSPPTVGNAWVGDFFGSACGSDDIGAEVLAKWTPPIPDPIISTANVLCQPGLVTLATGGAVFGGDYKWYNNATNVLLGTGSQITPFVGTTTTFRVHTSNNGCESLSYRLFTVTVGQPAITSVTSVSPTCYGATNGSITVTATGGNGALQYSNNAGATWQTSNVFSNLPAGFYNIWVKDASGCTVVYSGNSVVLTQPQPISIFVNKIDASCNGSSTGRIDIFAGGGSGNLQFSINGGTTYQPNSIFANLPAGSYNVYVKDANNCSYPFLGNPVVITEPTPVTATASVTNASCSGNNNGSISVTAAGGTSPYTYSLNNGPFFPNATFPGLLSGTYNILVADVNGCQGSVTATITNSYTISLAVQSQTDVSCAGGADGTVTLAVTGGVAPFQYSIDGGNIWQNSATFNNLSGGVYTLLAKDSNGCLANTTVTISEKPHLNVVVVSVTNVGCFGDTSGAINVVATGGDSTYNFLWSNSATTQNVSNLAAGVYSVTVTDGAGCSASASATITSNPQLILQLEKNVSVLCHGGNSGALDITVNGGVPGYSYAWSNGVNMEDIYYIEAGFYSVTVTDAAGCTVTDNYQVTQPAVQLSATTTVTDANCPGGVDGTATAMGAGGTAPYTYLWSNTQIGATATGLLAGFYVVTVSDSNSCTAVASATVGEPLPFSFNETIHDTKCNGSADGGVDISVSGATPGYNYFWSNGATSQNLTNVTAGTYSVTVTDIKNCTASKSYNIQQPPAIISSIAGSDPGCHGEATGFAVVSAGGGTMPYTYTWSTNPTQSGMMGVKLKGAQIYYVTIADANNCSRIDSIILNDPTPVVVTTVPTDVKCFNGSNGQVEIQATGGAGNYEYYVNGVYQVSPLFTGLPAGNYTAVAQDENNCNGAINFTIQQPQAIFVDAGPDVVTLHGQTVQLSGTATSPNGIIGYNWTPDEQLSCTSCQITNARPDSTTLYFLTVMDGDSCFNYDSVQVIVKYSTDYFIPTAFTPNGDHLNDYFEVDILGAQSIETSIFNRWGERVYYNPAQQNGNTNGNAWDGTKEGKRLPDDTYVYQLTVKFFDGNVKTVTGTVSVMR